MGAKFKIVNEGHYVSVVIDDGIVGKNYLVQQSKAIDNMAFELESWYQRNPIAVRIYRLNTKSGAGWKYLPEKPSLALRPSSSCGTPLLARLKEAVEGLLELHTEEHWDPEDGDCHVSFYLGFITTGVDDCSGPGLDEVKAIIEHFVSYGGKVWALSLVPRGSSGMLPAFGNLVNKAFYPADATPEALEATFVEFDQWVRERFGPCLGRCGMRVGDPDNF